MTLIRQSPAETRTGWGTAESGLLARGLDELGLKASPTQLAQLQTYGELLLKWNRTYNLLGATSSKSLIQSHLLDSLAILPALARWLPGEEPALLDIGTGAGLPGIVLAIMLERVPIALVEPVGKKTAFLRQAVAQCALPSVRVVECRIEDLDLSRDLPEGFARPHFICRAFTSLARFCDLCRPHLRDGSLLFAMKAARVAEELDQLSSSIDVLAVEALHTIEKDVQRNLVVMRAAHATSDTTRPGR
jgi:16S rRNA (guanine527-N7)-methyltransferase